MLREFREYLVPIGAAVILIVLLVISYLAIGIAVTSVIDDDCKHDWKVIAEETLPSALEQLPMGKIESLKIGSRNIYQKKHVCIVQCDKCGKIKKFVTVNP